MDKKNFAFALRRVTGFGATTTEILEHTRRFNQEGIRVHIYGDQLERNRIKEAGGICHSLFRLPIRRWRRDFFLRRFNQKLKSANYNLVVGHGDTSRQTVLSMHNCVHLAHEIIHGEKLAYQSVGKIHHQILSQKNFKLLIANSFIMKDDFCRRYQIDPKTIQVIYPGYDNGKFNINNRPDRRIKTRKDLGFKDNEIVVALSTSGDFKKRGVSLFIESLGLLDDASKKKIKIMIIGGEKNLGPYKNQLTNAGLSQAAAFYPPVSHVEDYYFAMDLLVYPALIEEFGQTVQEAFACGTPVLSSKRVGATELLGNDVPDLLLDAPDPKIFSARIKKLLDRPDLLPAMGRRGNLSFGFNTWDHNFKKTKEAYTPFIL